MNGEQVEEWKDVVGFEGLYEVSNFGRVRSKNTSKFLIGGLDRKGYQRVTLRKNGKTYTHLVHRLVAIAFIPNQEGKSFIDHINTIANDNRVENLRWCTYVENNNNPITRAKNSAAKTERNHPLYGKYHRTSTIEKMRNSKKNVSIVQFDRKMNLIRKWKSISEAERECGIPHGNIIRCCNGERHTAGSFIWRCDIE